MIKRITFIIGFCLLFLFPSAIYCQTQNEIKHTQKSNQPETVDNTKSKPKTPVSKPEKKTKPVASKNAGKKQIIKKEVSFKTTPFIPYSTLQVNGSTYTFSEEELVIPTNIENGKGLDRRKYKVEANGFYAEGVIDLERNTKKQYINIQLVQKPYNKKYIFEISPANIDASLIIDGKTYSIKNGKTVLEFEVRPDLSTIEKKYKVTSNGFKPVEGTFKVDNNVFYEGNKVRFVSYSETIPIEMKRPHGSAIIESQPLGAKVSVDGVNYGTTPLNIPNLSVGYHKITLSLANYEGESYSVEIKEGQNTAITASLKKSYASTYSNSDNNSKPSYYKKPNRKILKASCGYLEAGYQTGQMTGVAASAGAYLQNFNMELSGIYGLQTSNDIFWNYTGREDKHSFSVTYRPMSIGLKVGYGLICGTRLRFTPQIGASYLAVISNKGDSKCYAISANAGIRADIGIIPNISVFAVPEMSFAVSKSSIYQQLENVSPEIKKWKDGFNCRFGLCFNF